MFRVDVQTEFEVCGPHPPRPVPDDGLLTVQICAHLMSQSFCGGSAIPIIIPLYRRGNQRTKQLGDLPRDTQVVRAGTGTRTPHVWFQSPHSSLRCSADLYLRALGFNPSPLLAAFPPTLFP